MPEETQLLIQDIKNKFTWSVWARFALVAVGAVIVYVGAISGAYLRLSLELLTIVLTYDLIAFALCCLGKINFKLWQIITLGYLFELLDIFSITFIIYITGWVDSPYWFLYLVLIIISGFGMFSYYSISVFLIAFLSACFYLGMLLAAYLGLLPIYGPGLTLTQQQLLNLISNKAVFTIVSFMLISTTIYYFSRLLNQQRQELSSKNQQLLTILNKVKEIDRMKDEFVSTASHELRTPLSVVRENVSLIEDGITGEINPKQKKLLEVSRDNIDRLANILDDLLDISKIESHSLELARTQADICQLAVKAVELLKTKSARKNLNVTTRLPGVVFGWIDKDQMLRVFINLLDNAIKYTPEKGLILVGIEAGAREIRGFVSDTGMGIAAKDQPRIFERFVHLLDHDGGHIKGTGLGLSICKAIVEMHGGRIWVESEPGKGTKFTFAIPKVETHDRK